MKFYDLSILIICLSVAILCGITYVSYKELGADHPFTDMLEEVDKEVIEEIIEAID